MSKATNRIVKFGIIGAFLLVTAYTFRDLIEEKLTNWGITKLNFQVLRPTNFGFDYKTATLTFDLNFSLNNFLPTNFNVKSMLISVFQAIGTSDTGVIQWEKIAERKESDTQKTIILDGGENKQKIRMAVPISTSPIALAQAVANRVKGIKTLYKVEATAIIEGQPSITHQTTFEV